MFPTNDVVCTLLETPFHKWKDEDKKDLLITGRPVNSLQICKKKEIKSSGKSYNIKFKDIWFSEFCWLCTSIYLQKLFCWPCVLFSNKNNVWNKEGFSDFQNTARSLRKHGDSAEHLKCQLKLRSVEKNRNTIADALKENYRLHVQQYNENVRLNRLFLEIVIEVVLFLSKQELAFRGHDKRNESLNRGNFKELLTAFIKRSNLEIQSHYNKIKNIFSGDSKTIQNELIDCISTYMNDYVKTEVGRTLFFTVQVDDTTDITQISQCSIIIRYVNSDGVLVERFLGFHDVSADRTAENLFALVDRILKEFDYETKLIGQCYDGASVMSGHLNGLKQKVQDKAPQAIFVHCMVHRLNLVLQQSVKKISKCRIYFANVSGIPSFFHHSAKRTHALNSACVRRIPTVADTRWSSNSRLIAIVVQEWENLKNVFQFIMDDETSDEKSIRSSEGFLNKFNNFEFTFLSIVFNDLFGLTEVLYDTLQKKSLDVNYCLSKIQNTTDIIRSRRNEDYFNSLIQQSKALTPLTVRREHDVSSENQILLTFRVLYFEIVDTLLMEFHVRFQDYEKLGFLNLVDFTKFHTYVADFPVSSLQNLHKCYPKIFDNVSRLRNELSLLYSDESFQNVAIDKILENLQMNKDIFEETYKLLCLVMTISPTSVSVERSFSCLKRLKTYSRNSMCQARLSSLANISLQKELLCALMKNQPFYSDIIDIFASLKDRRIDLVYKK